jgi:osmoprotectant transport system substrate-binding protein
MANDGYPVSVMVTTVWARALVAKGARVAIRKIDTTAAQVTALRNGEVDLVQQYNGGLLRYFDKSSNAISQSEVDSALAAKVPAGLSVLRSTPAKDDVLLAVSATTATKFRLHSIPDLAGHLKDITLLLPADSTAGNFVRELSDYYGLTFAATKTTDFAGAKTIAAIKSTPAVGMMVASQWQIDANKFVALTDPEHFFFTENFIPLTSTKTITAAMRATLNSASAKLSLSALRGLRKKVATGEGTYTEVADAWLDSVGLR